MKPLLNQRKTAIAALLLVMLVAPLATPLASADSKTSARNGPNFTVSSLTLDGAGSVQDGTDIFVENATHVVEVIVSNIGSAAGTVVVSLFHQGSSSSPKSLVKAIEVGPISPGTSHTPVGFEWTASPGNGQRLFAETYAQADPYPADNEMQLYFDVRTAPRYLVGDVIGNNTPMPGLGQSEGVIDSSMQTFTATVLNEGVETITANMTLDFVNPLDPTDSHSFWSGEILLDPGSLKNGPIPDYTTYNMNTASFSGVYTLTVSVIFTGNGGWIDTQVISVSDVRFSDFSATLTTPSDRTTEPGLTTTLNYWLTNTGTQDDFFNINLFSTQGWATVVSHPTGQTPSFSQGQTINIQVDVTIPYDADRTATDTVILTLTSVQDTSTPPYSLSARTNVGAGEIFVASLSMPTTTQIVIPGDEIGFNATIKNEGNVEGSYILSAGFSSSSSRWEVTLGTYLTSALPADGSMEFSVNVTVPPIQMPLDQADHNRDGDTLSVWVQAIPSNGGVPVVQNTTLRVAPIIVVDPGLSDETVVLDAAEIIAGKDGNGVELFRPLDIEVRTNLADPLITTVDALIETGNVTFFTPNGGGFNESARWNASISNESLWGMSLGSTKVGALNVQGPFGHYPLAGVLDVPVTASIINPPQNIPNLVTTTSVTRNISIIVPPIYEANIVDKGPFDVPLGEMTSVPLLLENTGNEVTSYRLSVIDDLPDGWVTSINTLTGNSDVIADLSPDVSDAPEEGNSHLRDFNLEVTTDPLADAYSIQDVNIKVEDSSTGLLINIIPVSIRVGPYVNASLSPTNQTVNINTTLGETPLTRVYVTNTGNTPTIYSLWLDDSQAGEVNFNLESPNQILIAPGFTDSVKIRLSPTNDADSDGYYMARLWVETDTGVNLSAEIVANVSEQRDLSIDAPYEIGVLPGQDQVVNFTVTNSGNFEETFAVEVAVDGGWVVVPASQTMTLPIDEEIQGSVTVTIPELGEGISLNDGSVHNLTIRLVDQNTELTAGMATVRMLISPMFILDIVDWQEEMQYHRYWNRTFSATVMNMGNRDVTVDLGYEINKPGGVIPSNEWSIEPGAPSTLSMPVGQNVTFSFVVKSTDISPDLGLFALLSIHLTPQDASVDGDGFLNSTLKMSRFFAPSDIDLKPDETDGPMEEYIVYSHIPIGPSNAVAYELELCDVERLYDFSQSTENESLYPWSFTLVIDESTSVPLSLDPDSCGQSSAGPDSRIQLPLREAWDTSNPLKVIVDAPNRPDILVDDGWDLTFRLFHPTENNGYSVFNESTFRFQLDVFADPSVTKVFISSGTMEEGTDATVTATIRNDGTAKALFFEASLECSGSTVHTAPHGIRDLGPTEETEVSWQITSDTIDWWRQSVDGTCVVLLDTAMVSKNVEGNDRYVYKDEVYSWSPGQSSSFVALIIFALVSLVLARLNGQNEKFRLFSIYSGVLAFGFAFHLFNVIYWGPVVLALAALWIWRMTWMSTDEFRLIHEDYQRARKGVSTLYADHFQALADSRRQLRIILAMPVLGLLGVVLGIPPQIDASRENLMTIAAYVVIIAIGVWILVRRADSIYGALYGRLTDIEVKAIRIERDLSDPARLLNDLANDGINLDAIFEDLPTGGELGIEEEVSEDV